jgi:hypothetical protein
MNEKGKWNARHNWKLLWSRRIILKNGLLLSINWLTIPTQRFNTWLHPIQQNVTMYQMETAGSLETSVHFYQIIWRYIPPRQLNSSKGCWVFSLSMLKEVRLFGGISIYKCWDTYRMYCLLNGFKTINIVNKKSAMTFSFPIQQQNEQSFQLNTALQKWARLPAHQLWPCWHFSVPQIKKDLERQRLAETLEHAGA